MADTIEAARGADDIRAAARLFQEYAESLPIDLCFQGFAEELATLPGKYGAPGGEILLAKEGDGRARGCVAMRPLGEDGACEMKRLYVSPEARGRGLGRALMDAILDVARERGYREMRLDTLSGLTEAVSLYRNHGFVDIPAYHEDRVEGILFLGREL